jgi:4-hydroxy-tetrahydrodipicolinate synthase
MAVGAQGVVSVASNILPREIVGMVKAFADGKLAAAQKMHHRLYPLFKDLFIETNPVPVKAGLAMLGQIAEEYRLPLVPMNPSNRAQLRSTMKACGVFRQPG